MFTYADALKNFGNIRSILYLYLLKIFVLTCFDSVYYSKSAVQLVQYICTGQVELTGAGVQYTSGEVVLPIVPGHGIVLLLEEKIRYRASTNDINIQGYRKSL